MVTVYEFVVETLDYYDGHEPGNPDIIDTSGFDTLPEALAFANQCEEPWRIALRRDVGNDVEGLTDRGYAYPDANGRLPERFETCDGAQDGANVPKRFSDMVFPLDTRERD